MVKLRILIVDDESRMRKLVKDFLLRQNYDALEAANGEEAVDIFFREKDIALILLDVMMPKMDGWQVCREIRKESKVPIIMLTARGDERDELKGFELGVDEYISKPFSPKILMARIEAILRRTGASDVEEVIEVGQIVMNKTAHLVTVDGQNIDLSYKEFELLKYFLENQGIALSREKILNNVWNYDYFGDARTIDTHVKKLRSKMGALLVKPALKKTLKTFDASQYGGAPLLGLKGLVVKCHGNSKETEFKNSIIQCISFKEQNISERIRENLTVVQEKKEEV